MAIYVIDDHPLMRDAIVMLLRRQGTGSHIVELDRLGGISEAIAKQGDPELFCLDLKLPDTLGMSGIVELKNRYPKVPLAVISAAPAAEVEESCIEAGADIFIEKSAGASEMGAALRGLFGADNSFDESAEGDTRLSKRQKQLIIMLDQGLSNRDIAEQLEISEHTVKVHLWRLFRRMGVKSRTQAVHHARSHGLLGG